MTAPLRWRGWLILAATLLLFSACATTSASQHPVTGAVATTGPVTVTTNLSAYTTSDAIGATVTNSSKTAYFTQNGKSACTVLQLERFNATTGTWARVDGCGNAQPTQTLTIAESSSVPYTLAPTSASDANAWQAGTYRIAVTYSTQADGITNPQEAHSAAFTVKG